VLLHYTAPPVTGGVESVLGAHARRLRRAGHDVLVVAGRGDCQVVPELDSRHPEVEALAQRLARGGDPEPGFERLRARIRERLEPLLLGRQLVVAHNVMTMPFNLPLAAALSDTGLPVLAWTHDVAWSNPRYREYRRPGWPWSILCRPQPGARYVVVSRARRQELAAAFGCRERDLAVVPNGIDALDLLGVGAATRRLARRGGFEDARPLVLVPVRVTRRKRLERALEAASELLPAMPRLRMVVSGPLGPHNRDNLLYWRELLELRSQLGLEEAVRFLHELAPPEGPHPVDDAAVSDLYRLADVVLLPSESEGFGLPVLEAALARAPLVCAEIPVLREAGGRELWTFPPGAGGARVAAAVERALGSRAARARERVLASYAWPAVMPAVERAIEACLA
jgi:mannosylglucosylglycerate synthase